VNGAALELTDVSKDYRALRPLRIARLAVAPAEAVAILGLDQPAAEIFVNLVTGATLPDRGTVAAFGRSTASISDSSDWLAFVDRFGIVSERAVLLDALTVIQNLAMPFTVDIEPPPDHVRRQAESLAVSVDLPEPTWTVPVRDLDDAGRARVRLGRALALDPGLLLFEHASARLSRRDAEAFGATARTAAAARRAAIVAITGDEPFARTIATRVLALNQATGVLTERRRRYFF